MGLQGDPALGAPLGGGGGKRRFKPPPPNFFQGPMPWGQKIQQGPGVFSDQASPSTPIVERSKRYELLGALYPTGMESCVLRAVAGRRASSPKQNPHQWYQRRLLVWKKKCIAGCVCALPLY